MWLRDSLPSDLRGVRVLIYGYCHSGASAHIISKQHSINEENKLKKKEEVRGRRPLSTRSAALSETMSHIVTCAT